MVRPTQFLDALTFTSLIRVSRVSVIHYESLSPSFRIRVHHLKTVGKHVRHLLSSFAWPVDLGTYLPECRGIENLAVWIRSTCPNLIELVDGLPLRRLSISFGYLFGLQHADFRHHPFPDLTHLEIIDEQKCWSTVKEISLLPNLTHLAYCNFPGSEVIESSLKHCEKLRVLVVLISDSVALTEQDHLQDRIYVVLFCDVVAVWDDDWHTGAQGGRDFWVQAEEVVAGRSLLQVGKYDAGVGADN